MQSLLKTVKNEIKNIINRI
uniref:Uncharacterized protein n=1 Tax=Anguilla anguilla TaxID=7936 RepID=A0A0E9XQM0_ANGAN